MSIAPVYAILRAAAAVTAIVGTNPARIYPAGNIPQVAGMDPNANLPCVTWQMIGGHPENMLSDRPVVENQRIQIDCWAVGSNGFEDANALADAVQVALELSGYCVSLNGHDFDPETRRYRESFDWSFWVQR